ncbi:MAG: flagellar export protein FliJ [Spirochaetia bacterium]|jgi:flagellar FliJ protein|nr:flagellar export protein FliJ [Spirochaetia bacterium]
MKQFSFKLEKLLEMKKHVEKEKSLELAEVTGRYLNILNSIEDMKVRKKQILISRFKYADNNPSSLLFDELQITAIKNKILKLQENLEAVFSELEQIRKNYVNALKEKKVMEKLKDKKTEEHKKDEAAAESRTIDDLVITNFASGRGEVKQWD